MDKRVILAVAGAGKTYYLCHDLNPHKKNLILAYTHSNIKNIKKELMDQFGSIPELTSVLTFDSFLYRFMICPYEPSILSFFGVTNFKRIGLTMESSPNKSISGRTGRRFNPYYHKNNDFHHYIKGHFYYCDTMAELIMKVKKGRNSLIKRISENLNSFYDQILVDEFQDYRKYNFKVLMELVKQTDNILLVGDYFQHSVAAVNNSGEPFENKTYEQFKDLLISKHLEVDDQTLLKSRRCPKPICDFVKEKLNINIEADNDNKGKVFILDGNREKINDILKNDDITKLMYSNASKYVFKAVNWSYSKGDTLDDICVILTDKFKNMNDITFSTEEISQTSINKIYVAMTRTKGNLYIITKSVFDEVKNLYRGT